MATIDSDWVSASRTRNYCQRDPLLDWLDRHGEGKGFVPDHKLPGHDERTDFLKFVFAKGQAFEAAVVGHLATLVPGIVTIAAGPTDVMDPEKAGETLQAIRAGRPVIAQAVLHNEDRQTYGAADLLVRSDVLRDLFPESITDDQARVAALEASGGWHYRVVDIKYSTLDLLASGHASKGHLAYMAQVHVYNEALGRLQGYVAPAAYLLGRGWRQGKGRGSSCMERLGPVEQAHVTADGFAIADLVRGAVAWIRRMRCEGDSWSPLAPGDIRELRPNMRNSQDGHWHGAKQLIASETAELTTLWNVGPDLRDAALAGGIRGWTDPGCSAASIGLTGKSRPGVLDVFLEMNRPGQTEAIRPDRVSAGRDIWGVVPPLEFFVDFETVNGLDDDFSRIPDQNGAPLITMIGCGHYESGEWSFSQFAVPELTEDAEARIIDEWLAHLEAVTARLWPEGNPLIYHWSPAETSTLDSAYDAARARHPDRGWPVPTWYDFLKEVIRAEPVIVRGAFGFGLKAVVRAMHAHGLIETTWKDSSVDGLGAMVGTWWASREASRTVGDMNSIALIAEIGAYNEVDCRAMAEVVRCLRTLQIR